MSDTELRDLIDSYGSFMQLIGRYEPHFPALTKKMLGIEADVSFTAIVTVLDKVILNELGVQV